MVVPYSPIAVNTGSKLVVIDTGTGEGNFERSIRSGRPVPLQPEGRGH